MRVIVHEFIVKKLFPLGQLGVAFDEVVEIYFLLVELEDQALEDVNSEG